MLEESLKGVSIASTLNIVIFQGNIICKLPSFATLTRQRNSYRQTPVFVWVEEFPLPPANIRKESNTVTSIFSFTRSTVSVGCASTSIIFPKEFQRNRTSSPVSVLTLVFIPPLKPTAFLHCLCENP